VTRNARRIDLERDLGMECTLLCRARMDTGIILRLVETLIQAKTDSRPVGKRLHRKTGAGGKYPGKKGLHQVFHCHAKMDILQSAIQNGDYIVDDRPSSTSGNTLFRKVDMIKFEKLPLVDYEKQLMTQGMYRRLPQSSEDFILKNTELYKNYLL